MILHAVTKRYIMPIDQIILVLNIKCQNVSKTLQDQNRQVMNVFISLNKR
jgi:hypothetical protein